MILEEVVGYFVALVSSLIQTPPISRESLQGEYTLIFEENLERDEVYEGFIHREYEQEAVTEVPYYEEHTSLSVLVQADQERPSRRSLYESFLRSCKLNLGIVMAVVFILGSFNVGMVYVDLNMTNACIEWMQNNLRVPSGVQTLQKVGISFNLLPLFSWFPASVAMLRGFKEFKSNYLPCLFVCQLVTGSISCVYRIIVFDKLATASIDYNQYRLPSNVLFIFSLLCCAYLVARKFKQVNPATSYGVLQIFVTLSIAFIGSTLLALVYTYIIVKHFRETEGRIKKAIIAALAPGLMFPLTAISKYIVLRKSTEIVNPERAFVMCYFLRGASIVLYRTMQADFNDIWLFIALSLLHGVSNVLSKATLNWRIKIWKFIIKGLNRTCCVPRLEVRPLNSPRIRRLNADLEIQNILFEYTTVILSQAYLACYLVMSFDGSRWQVIKSCLLRIGISVAIDFVFNIISVFIQVHFYDIPMRKVWLKYWWRHVIANVIIITVIISYFGASLVNLFSAGQTNMLEEHKLRNCTSVL